MELYTQPLTDYAARIEAALPTYLPEDEPACQPVIEGMHYACENGGKRLRPVLLLEFCRLCGGNPEQALPFACALEIVHSYSLVHDDLPCMDNSPMRRGKPSVHAAYGETMALLTGDALLNRAFETMLCPQNRVGVPADRALAAAFCLADAAGIAGMIGGQVMDLNAEGKQLQLPQLQQLQHGKTARLIMAACEMGCRLAGGEEKQCAAATEFGRLLGLCFQIVDDILDVIATPEQLGKPIGGDDRQHKVTYVSLLGLEEARRLARQRADEALVSLAAFPRERTGPLRQLVEALLLRSY